MSLIYFLLWLIFNGRITFEIIVSGALISVLIDFAVRKIFRLNITFSNLLKFIKIFPYVLFYVFVLLIEIFRSGFAVIKLVSASEVHVEPCLMKFKTSLKSQSARTALANSLSLTPGTLTVSLEGSELMIHALDHDMADGLKGNIFERILTIMERRLNV